MANGGAPAGPASAVQGFVGEVMSTVTAPVDALNLAVAKATLKLLEFLPKMPAARLYTDLVFQFGHSHPHPPSFGFPIPSMGPILASGCMSVLINGLPAARNGDMGLAVWCGGYFPIFEVMTGSSHVFIGGSRAARQLMDVTFHCLPDPFGGKWGLGKLDIAMAVFGVGMSALGLAAAMEGEAAAEANAEKAEVIASESESDDQAAADAASAAASAAAAGVGTATAAAQLAADIAAAAMGLLMGKDPGVGFPFGIITMGSPNVLIGGFPMPGWMTILKGLGKMLKPLIRRIQLKMPQGRLRQAMCALTGHPVEIASGRMFTTKTDFRIDGRVPINFERIYDTSAIDYEGSLGCGWIHPYEQHLWESKKLNCLILRNNENRQVRFDKLTIGERQFQPLERTWLERTKEHEFKLFDCKDGLTYRFGRTDNLNLDFSGERNALRLLDISDRNGNRVELKYKENLLSEIHNGSGTHVELFYSEISGKTRLVEIEQHLKNNQAISLMRYAYNEESELHTATDRTYQPYIYEYENHLLTKETNRNKLSFHFEYDGAGTTARCVHTWGDGNIHERRLEYFPKARVTKVRDGLGGETVYHYNDLDLVTKIFDAGGGIVNFEYGDSGELLAEIDELGRRHSYEYDEQLNCVAMTKRDGTRRQFSFNEFCLPVSITDETDATWTREYDERGNLKAAINPLGARREYEHNPFGDVTVYRDALGHENRFEWTNGGAVRKFQNRLGASSFYEFNERELLSKITITESGITIRYEYDDAGRIRRVTESDAQEKTLSVRRFEYDAQNNLISKTDALGNRSLYRYGGYDKLIERTDALGFSRKFEYDSNERVTEITNEKGEEYFFEYDLLDRIISETAFDGAKTVYKYNAAGEAVYMQDALGRETFFRNDEMGRLVSRLRSDATTVNYVYDESGKLIEAQNPSVKVRRQYNAAWQVVREEQNDTIVEYKYDAEGRRTLRKTISSGGVSSEVKYETDAEGNLLKAVFAGREIKFERDRLGRTVKRQNANDLFENFEYGGDGNIKSQRVSVGANGREIVRRNYEWDALGNLVQIGDSLRGARRYGYDALERLQKVERIISGQAVKLPDAPDRNFSNSIPPAKRLWSADANDFDEFSEETRETEIFQYDADGNLVERDSSVRGKKTFKYERGDRLSEREKIVYIYDAVGNLIEKSSGIEATYFRYDADNQVVGVIKNGRETEFEYDAFGRRTSKRSNGVLMNFVWDESVLLSESKDSQLVTEYVHEQFVPLAKFGKNGVETYHTDYLGTPKEVTNERGEIVWQGVYDEYGRVDAVKNQTEQNIRFQGQYEDAETGLFYNLSRYYDADSCRYINQDPLGLVGDFNFYKYCRNPINWLDPWGLDELVYQLLDKDGKVIYYGITERTALDRGNEHIDSGKKFAKMQVIAEGLTHDQARSLEGALIRQRLAQRAGDYDEFDSIEEQLRKSGLLNKNRGRDIDRWKPKTPLKNVPQLDEPRDVDGLKNSKKRKAC